MFNLLLALITGLVIGWNFHSFFMQLNPPNILRNDINFSKSSLLSTTSKPISTTLISEEIMPKEVINQKVKSEIPTVVTSPKEENTSTPKAKIGDSFYELLKNNLFSDAMSLYLDATDTILALYRSTLLEHFESKNQNEPHESIVQMLEFQELEVEAFRVDLESFHATEYGNDEEKAKILLELIKEKLNPKKAYQHEIALNKIDEHFTIDISVNNQALTLLLDTGATLTMVNENKLTSLTLIKENIILNTAGGTINAKLQESSTFTVGDIELKNFQIVTSSFKQKEANGLLGMNFFKLFDFKIDHEKSMLYLSEKGQ